MTASRHSGGAAIRLWPTGPWCARNSPNPGNRQGNVNQFWSVGHLGALAFTAVAIWAAVVAGRRWPSRRSTWAARGLAGALVVNQTAYCLSGVWNGNWSIRYGLPLNLCDLAAFVAGGALLWRRRRLVEMTYFWGMAATTMGLLWPDRSLSLGSYWYFEYYIDHCGVIIAALFLVCGLGYVPGKGAVTRAFQATLAYAAAVGVFDLATRANYFNLAGKPPRGTTPLDLFAPWPWYIIEAAVFALLAFGLLALPFDREERAGTPVLEQAV
jgi:hypothetical integral membrane protein (TIGR02206 family)